MTRNRGKTCKTFRSDYTLYSGGGLKRKKKTKILRFDKSRICPDNPHCATPTKVVMCAGVPDVVDNAKFCQNWLGRGFGSLRG